MKVKQFKCTLLSDVIINQKAATEGSQATLDFIPGSNFLGIAASSLYKDTDLTDERKMLIFHSGCVRFGDAHPAVGNKRSLRVPAAWFVPKITTAANKGLLLVHPHITNFEEYKREQPKQCRTGFYCLDPVNKMAEKVDVDKTFTLKSAYDKEFRRSKDEQMFGYQSLNKGLELRFEICVDEEITSEELRKIEISLIGKKRVGRSRTAQYGLVRIEALGEEWQEKNEKNGLAGNIAYIYADSRLIFLDEYGNSTFTPQACDFHMSGEIDWEKSQIRTFQYAPWNSTRQARDADRCGIEKGSVIVVKKALLEPDFNGYVGVYQNEGFGKILINPDFLEAKDNGKAVYKIMDKEEVGREEVQQNEWISAVKEVISLKESGNILSRYLGQCKEEEIVTLKVYELVQKFVRDSEKERIYNDESFASQWGTIRNLAIQFPEKDTLLRQISNYLDHGVAAQKWAENKRKEKLLHFLKMEQMWNIGQVEDITEQQKIEMFLKDLSGKMIQLLVINLAAEMSKKIGRTNV